MMGRAASRLASCVPACVKYQGGIAGVGVTIGKEKVYLVFWGNQWGTQGTNSQGRITFSGDTNGVAPDLQAFFAGLGSSTDKWSGVMTQYCQGVAKGAVRCPTAAAHVAYPTGGALAGVWEDTTVSSPAQSTGHQLAEEAEAAATHFGNTTTAANRDTQYVILSPAGTNPDNYEGQGFCAWHDYTGDSTLDGGGGAPGSLVAFTNLPYLPDAGTLCGAGLVNPGNILDGVTVVGGHEYAETITDQYPAGGWVNSAGAEVGDLCAWKTSGAGRSQDITLSTGSFAVQGIWSNLANLGKGACSVSHSIVT
jgi:serine protease